MTQQVGTDLKAENVQTFKTLIWSRKRKFLNLSNFSAKSLCINSSWADGQNEDTTICQMSVTGLDLQSYLSQPLCTSQTFLDFNLPLDSALPQAAVGMITIYKT